MMKKVFYFKFSAILLLFCLLCGCSSGSKEVVETWVSSDNHKLTQRQMLADYDAMWKDIDDNYSLMGVAQRMAGKNYEKVKTDYRKKVSAVQSDKAFFELLTNCIGEFQGIGHMCIFDHNEYSMNLNTYQKLDAPQYQYLYRVLNNPTSRAFYSYVPVDIYKNTAETASKNGGSGNISTKIIEQDKTAYLKIKSLGSPLIDVDAPKISDFFLQIKDYQNCIIDIRGNRGGDADYWKKNIVTPNIDHDMQFTSYELGKGESAKQYLSTVQTVEPISQFKKLSNTNESDLAQMDYFVEDKTTFHKSETENKAFLGQFYLLTDGDVYSSAEAFAVFCKQSGFAKIVGDTTGGDGVGIEQILFALPHSGICLRFSASLGLNSDGASNEEFGTQPDYPCSKGKDALQTCLDIIQAGQ